MTANSPADLLTMPLFSLKTRWLAPSTTTLPSLSAASQEDPRPDSLAPSLASTTPLSEQDPPSDDHDHDHDHDQDHGHDEDTHSLAPHSSTSSSSLPPFSATKSLQIETLGRPVLALPFSSRRAPILIHAVDRAGHVGPVAYQALRTPDRSCALLRTGERHPVCTTSWEGGRRQPTKIQLCGALAADDEISVERKKGLGLTRRSVVMRTPLGTLEWRYRRDRDATRGLLVCDKVTLLAVEGGRQVKERRQVARLVRSAEFRTKGTGWATAGSGGRLMMDLGEWEDRKPQVGEQVEALVVAGCLVMLKRERDRRRVNQAFMAGG